MTIWVILRLWLLQIKHVCTSFHVYILFIFLGKCIAVKNPYLMVGVCLTVLRNYQTIFQSGCIILHYVDHVQRFQFLFISSNSQYDKYFKFYIL